MPRADAKTVVSRGRLEGFERLTLDNGIIRADVLPALGAKIWTLSHTASGHQWLWHNPKTGLKTGAAGGYDDNWAGGWEELFPNDAPGVFEGRSLPDHGEWWSLPWSAEISPEGDSVVMRLDCRSLKAECEKRVTLKPGSSRLKVSYRITNREKKAVHFLFKQHLALALTPEHRIELPGGQVTPVDLGFSTLLKSSGPFDWPAGLDRLPPEREGHKEFVYVSQLPQGWCGAVHQPSGARLRLHFDLKMFPHTWLFMTFGGWRGFYTTVLEPCTNKPKDLSEALRLGQCASLEPGKSLETEVEAELS